MSLTKANTRMLEGDLPASQITGNLPIGQVPTIPNSKLENSSVTINGSAVPLGGSTTVGGGGKIGQVVNTVSYTQQNITTTSYTDMTDMSLSITPSSASSKILALVHINGIFVNTASEDAALTKLVVTPSGGSASTIAVYSGYSARAFNNQGATTVSGTTLYNVGSAVEHTFKVQIRTINGNSVIFNTNDSSNTQLGDNSSNSTITLMEVLP